MIFSLQNISSTFKIETFLCCQDAQWQKHSAPHCNNFQTAFWRYWQTSRFCGYWQNLMHLTMKKICIFCLFYSFIFYISSVATKSNWFSVLWKGKQYFFLQQSTAIKFLSSVLHQIHLHIPKPYFKIHHNHHHELFSWSSLWATSLDFKIHFQ